MAAFIISILVTLGLLLSHVLAVPPVLHTVQAVNHTANATTPPFIIGDFAYVGGTDGYIYAQNITAGWGIHATMSADLGISGGSMILFNISANTFGVLYKDGVICLELDLSVKWTYYVQWQLMPWYVPYYQLAPVVWNDAIFVGSSDNYVHAIQASMGDSLWKTKLQFGYGLQSANMQMAYCPTMRALFCANGGEHVSALSMDTGVQLWFKRVSSNGALKPRVFTIHYDASQSILYAGGYNDKDLHFGNYYLLAAGNGAPLRTLSSRGPGLTFLQSVKHDGVVYMTAGSYLITYNTRTNTAATGPQFTVNGSAATILSWTWALDTMWIQAASRSGSGLFRVAPNASWVLHFEVWDFSTHRSVPHGLTYVHNYFLFSASYLYLVPANKGPQGSKYTWSLPYSGPWGAAYSPRRNGTLVVANSLDPNLLVVVSFDTTSPGGLGARYEARNPVNNSNIVVNGSIAYTCDAVHSCYGVDSIRGNGTAVHISGASANPYGGVALTQTNLFSARTSGATYMASMSTATFETLPASGTNGQPMDTAVYPTVVGPDGNIYQATSTNVAVFNGAGGELLKTIPAATSSQVAVSEGLVFFTRNDKIFAYTTNTSALTPVWSHTNPKGNAYSAGPKLYGNNVYVGDDAGYTYCYDRKTSALIWKDRISFNHAQVQHLDAWNGNVYAFTATFVTVYDMSSGLSKGIGNFGSNFTFDPIITPDGTLIAYTNTILAVNLTTNQFLYHSTALTPTGGCPPLFVNGALYWTSRDGIYATNAYTGDVLFLIADRSLVTPCSLAASQDHQTLWYSTDRSINAVHIGIAGRYGTAAAFVAATTNARSSNANSSLLGAIGAVVGTAVVAIIAIIGKSRDGGKKHVALNSDV